MTETPDPPHAFDPRLHFVDESDIFWDVWRGTGLTGTAYFAARNDKVPLIVAAQKNDLPEVQRLLASSETSGGTININEVGLEEESALHMAAALGHLPIVEALLVAGANPSLKDGEGSTPLIHCARFCPPEKSVDVVKALIAASANPLEAASYDMAPIPALGYAIRALNVPLTQYLVPFTPLDYPSESPAHRFIIYETFLAATKVHKDGITILKHLLEKGLPVETTDLCKCTDVGLTGTGVETAFQVLHDYLVQKQQLNTESLTQLAPNILYSVCNTGKKPIPVFQALVEKYGVDPNNASMAIAVLSIGHLDLLRTAINSGLDLKTALPTDTIREVVNGRRRAPEFLQLIRDQIGLPQP